MPVPGGIQQLLTTPWQQVAQVRLHQTRPRRFRAISLVELPFYAVLWFVAVSVWWLLSIFAVEPEVELPRPRFFEYWQELEVVLLAANDEVLARASTRPASTAEVDELIAAVLTAARRSGVMVIQTLEGEVVEHWYGGMPLLAPPIAVDPQAAEAILRGADLLVTNDGGGFCVRRESEPIGRVREILALVGTVISAPFLILQREFKATVEHHRRNLRLGCTTAVILEVTPDGLLRCRSERGPDEEVLFAIQATQLLAISFTPKLLDDRDTTRTDPILRFVTPGGTFDYPLDLDRNQGLAMRALLVGAIQFHWHALVSSTQHP